MSLGTEHFSITKLSDTADIDELVAIWIAGSRTAHHFIDAAYWLGNAQAMKETYLPQSETWIYRNNAGAIEGFFSLVDDYMASLFVRPETQSKGIGSRLIAKAKSLKDALQLAVYVKNNNAVGFYKKQGFIIEETRVDTNTGEEEYVMTWNK